MLLLAGCFSIANSYSPTSTQTATPTQTQTPSPTPTQPEATTEPTSEPAPETVSPQVAEATEPKEPNTLETLLAELKIEPEAVGGYDRDLFQHWIDADSDGCNTRREVLIIESVIEPGIGDRCAVFGRWFSAYDGRSISDASQIDIDHFVPLAEAWRSGANQWSSSTRKRFANDLGFSGSLIAVSASSNRSKSDQDPASWLPGNSEFLCSYTYNWLAVKYRWSLSIDSQEALALADLVPGCAGKYEIPKKAEIVIGGPAPKPSNGLDPRFSSCREAKAQGYGPYVSGVDPEYGWYRDGDSDGTVCE